MYIWNGNIQIHAASAPMPILVQLLQLKAEGFEHSDASPLGENQSSRSVFEVSSPQTRGLSPGKHTLLITFGHTAASLSFFFRFILHLSLRHSGLLSIHQPLYFLFSFFPAQDFQYICGFIALDSLFFPPTHFILISLSQTQPLENMNHLRQTTTD